MRRTFGRAALAATLLVGISLGSATAAFNTTELAGVGTGDASPDGYQFLQDMSADGSVVFLSTSSVSFGILGANWIRVYLRSGSTTTAITPAPGYSVERAGISDNGRYVVYTLGWGDAPAVYLYDTTDQQTIRVVTIGSTFPEFVGNSQLDISDDGRYVLFDTVTGLDATDTNGVKDVYRYDRQLAVLDWVSRNPDGTPSDGESTQPHMTPDGSSIVFTSTATNLVADDTNAVRDAFMWTPASLTRVSTDATGTQLTAGSGGVGLRADITDDGRYVVFDSYDALLSGAQWWTAVILKDTVTGAVEIVSHDDTKRINDVNARNATISGDGSTVAYESDWPFITTGIQGNHYDTVVKDRAAGTIELMDISLSGPLSPANAQAYNPLVNVDGTVVAFDSYATDLVASTPVLSNGGTGPNVYRVTRTAKHAQTLTFANPGGKTMAQSPLALLGTASSGLPVIYTSLTPLVCTEGSATGSPMYFLTTGSCKITASQPGNQAYTAATSVTRTFNVNKANQSISFPNPGAQTLSPTPVPVALGGTASSALPVTFTTLTPAVCTVDGATATLVTNGSCSITASQPGNTVYNAATSVTRAFNVNKASQNIAFNSPGTQSMGQPVSVQATINSPLNVTFTTTTPLVCTAPTTDGPNTTTITLVGAGTCTIKADQAGDAYYKPASTVSRNFTVTKVAQIITFTNPGAQTLGSSPMTLLGTVDSPLTLAYTTTTPTVCTVVGATLTLNAVGTCTVKADQAGNATYRPANTVSRNFAVR